MSRKRADRRGRFARRVVIGGVIGAGVVFGLSQSASAAVTARFSASIGVLSVFGDGLDNNIQISRTPAGVILINGGAVPVSGRTATVANVRLIQVFGERGNDTIALDEANGTLPRTALFGGVGNDTLVGSNGVDLLFGGDGDDVVDGQQGNDVGFLGAGDDVFQWDPGDGSDVVGGQAGTDRMLFNGSGAAEIFEASANRGRVRFTRNVGAIVMDLDDIEAVDVNALGGTDTTIVNDLSGTDVVELNGRLAGAIGGTAGDAAADVVIVNGTNGDDIVDVSGLGSSANVVGLPTRVNITGSDGANDALNINALGGDDSVTATTAPAGVVNLTTDGGTGDDTLLGSQGADVLLSGDGNDLIVGDDGNDTALMGAGADVFQWNPDDGNDTLEGQDGTDQMLFFGANVSENINIAANGGRVQFLRNVAAVTMDLDDVETIDFRALGGADNIVVGDLSGTDMATIGSDLRGPDGGGDGAADTITVNGTNGPDVFGAAGDAGGVDVFGVQTAVNVTSQEQANDRLTLNGLGGDDVINASSLEANGIQLSMNGGLGDDLFLGSEGNDLINGGDGDDTALMGGGDDVFVWNPGDDDDTLEGQAGFDRMLFNGANNAENIDVAANGGRVRFFRDVANVTMDINDVEAVDFNALGGADRTVVNDLSGTDVTELNLNLAGALGDSGGDAQPDSIVVQGTNSDDIALVVGDASGVSVIGLPAQVNITAAEAANDRLTLNALAGDDAVDASALRVGSIQLTEDGGAGNDVLVGGAGDDVLLGGAGDDVLIGGPGTDIVDGGDGDDVEIQLVADGDTVTSATTADRNWLATHARIVDHRTVLDVGGKARTLPSTDLARLIHDATTAAAATPATEATLPETTTPATVAAPEDVTTAAETTTVPDTTTVDAVTTSDEARPSQDTPAEDTATNNGAPTPEDAGGSR